MGVEDSMSRIRYETKSPLPNRVHDYMAGLSSRWTLYSVPITDSTLFHDHNCFDQGYAKFFEQAWCQVKLIL